MDWTIFESIMSPLFYINGSLKDQKRITGTPKTSNLGLVTTSVEVSQVATV